MNATNPASKFKAVTPSDTLKIGAYIDDNSITIKRCRALYIGGAGNLVVKDEKNNSITFTGVLAGVIYPLSTDHVLSTGTTATNIVAIF